MKPTNYFIGHFKKVSKHDVHQINSIKRTPTLYASAPAYIKRLLHIVLIKELFDQYVNMENIRNEHLKEEKEQNEQKRKGLGSGA